MDALLPDYSTPQCIQRGTAVLQGYPTNDAQVLETEHVNQLVRNYTFLSQRPHASEEWWGGAVALDHFFLAWHRSCRS